MRSEPTIGCTLPTSGPGADVGALRGLAQTAEGLGFASAWVSDHVVIPERVESAYPYSPDGRFHLGPTGAYLEPLIALTYLAGVTERIRLGTHVLILPYRNPVVMAKEIATLDVLSRGRVDLGVGVGWMREEFEALGYDYFDRRGAVADEQIRLMRTLWTEDVAAFEGDFYRFARLGAHPHPTQRPHPPIWVGGHTRPAIRRAARLGDGWLPIGARPPATLPPEEIARGRALLREEATRAGRDPAAIKIYFSTGITPRERADEGSRRPFEGTPEQIAADVAAYRAVGVDGFLFGFGREPAEVETRMRWFADRVRPALT